MSYPPPCKDCGNEVPAYCARCPHCARPGRFPNVIAAENPDEVNALDDRYKAAVAEAERRGDREALAAFETVLARSRAVLARSAPEVLRLARDDREVYASYYELAATSRLPPENEWDPRRRVADAVLFTNYEKDLRFAALSLEATGAAKYGTCSIVLRTELIDFRASALEENSVFFVERHKLLLGSSNGLPKGFRSNWRQRCRLSVAKLGGAVTSTTTAQNHASLLLSPGATKDDDRFIEIQIWGPMTVRTFEEVTINARETLAEGVAVTELKKSLEQHGVVVHV